MNEMSNDNSLEHAKELFWQLYSDGEYADAKALTQGFSAGEAQKLAQGNLKSVNKGELEAVWLAEAQRRLPEEKWRRVDNQWRETARSSGQYPFSSPVHWAPYILVGDPKVTISPSKPNVKL